MKNHRKRPADLAWAGRNLRSNSLAVHVIWSYCGAYSPTPDLVPGDYLCTWCSCNPDPLSLQTSYLLSSNNEFIVMVGKDVLIIQKNAFMSTLVSQSVLVSSWSPFCNVLERIGFPFFFC